MMQITSLNQFDMGAIKELLIEAGLPVDDLDAAPIRFYGLKTTNRLQAIGALEIYGEYAILRSLAVKKEFQNKGFGKQIASFLEKEARLAGISQLFLLTTTAERFFKKQEYTLTNRQDCPKEILTSQEFAHLCPSSAICFAKKL